jgi:hypothetical protein
MRYLAAEIAAWKTHLQLEGDRNVPQILPFLISHASFQPISHQQ